MLQAPKRSRRRRHHDCRFRRQAAARAAHNAVARQPAGRSRTSPPLPMQMGHCARRCAGPAIGEKHDPGGSRTSAFVLPPSSGLAFGLATKRSPARAACLLVASLAPRPRGAPVGRRSASRAGASAEVKAVVGSDGQSRTGVEGRISHLNRRYGLERSRLKGDQGQQILTEWAMLAYNTDTLAVRGPAKHFPPLTPPEQTHHLRTAARHRCAGVPFPHEFSAASS